MPKACTVRLQPNAVHLWLLTALLHLDHSPSQIWHSAILVGIGTLLADDPQFNVKPT